MNRKKYLITIIVLGVLGLAALIGNYVYSLYNDGTPYTDWTLILLGILVAFIFIRYRIQGSMQRFSQRYNMLLDYDLDVKGALELALKAKEEAPTKNLEVSYEMYIGMAYYYTGDYELAIKTFNQIDLRKMHIVFHSLIFAFTAYCAYEIDDQETFDIALERLEGLVGKVSSRYKQFVSNYVELLTALKSLSEDPENYKEIIEKHFGHDNGYISRKLNFNFRMAKYYDTIGDTLEMDKCLAFCIANGKEHHTAIKAKALFKGSVNVEDYVWDPTAKAEEIVPEAELIEGEPSVPEEDQLVEENESKDE